MSKRQVSKEQRDRIETWRKDAETLSYEEAMQALDLLLAEPVSYTHLTLPTS